MRVLLISNYLDGTGWSKAGQDYILALDAVGIDVVPRPIRLNGHQGPIPKRLEELETRSSRGCDVVIQHCLPNLLEYNGRFDLNVAMFATETSDFRATGWADRINTMDQAIVFNRQSAEACRRSGVKVPICVVPHATDISRFQRSYGQLESLAPYKKAGDFLFYTIGEFTRRKNHLSLFKAYFTEFRDSENVRLVVKTSSPGEKPEVTRQRVEQLIAEIQRGLKLPSYPEVVVLTERLTEEGMMRLHSTCDVFVQPSYGEAWSQPAFDSMAAGKTPIVTRCTGYLDYLSDSEGWLVNCHEEPVFGVTDSFEDLFVGTETWWGVSIPHLRRCMREAFEDSKAREERAQAGIARAYDFAYEAVGLQLYEALTDGQGKSP